MDAVLLDTDVFSYLLKGDDRADLYRPHIEGKRPAVSFVTVGELYSGAFKRSWTPNRVRQFELRLRATVVVPYDIEICRVYGRLILAKTPSGSDRVIAANDRWIAACAIRHGLTLITNNRKHFEGIPELTVISEAPKPAEPQSGDLPLDPPATRH